MYSKILVPIDGSPTSNRGVAEAIRLAKLTGARLKLLHVMDAQLFAGYPMAAYTVTQDLWGMLKEAGEAILAAGRDTVQAAGVPVETELCEGLALRVCDAVLEAAQRWGADALVLGTHGRRGVSRALLGSDAEQIVRHACIPVLLVRGEPAGPAARAARRDAETASAHG